MRSVDGGVADDLRLQLTVKLGVRIGLTPDLLFMASTLPTFSDLTNTTITVYTTSVSSSAIVVGSITELRAIPTTANNMVIIVQDKGDGFIGIYNWSPASVAVDDGLLVIEPDDGGPGRWLLNV